MTYFSVDVETTSTDILQGELLTVGVVVVSESGYFTGQEFYTGRNFQGLSDTDTMKWWTEHEEAKKEAFSHDLSSDELATALLWWVNGVEPDKKKRVFVANPASFDRNWIDMLYSSTRIENPFPYRSLCLRSMRFGLSPGQEWGAERDYKEFHNNFPHHALEDARSQALDLNYLLGLRDHDRSD
jgi:DNA polymerase III epsilon subunit-like protein